MGYRGPGGGNTAMTISQCRRLGGLFEQGSGTYTILHKLR
jgi:hypothetical protein